MSVFIFNTLNISAQSCKSELEFTVKVTPSHSYKRSVDICYGSDFVYRVKKTSGDEYEWQVKSLKKDTVCRFEADCDDHTVSIKVCQPAETNIFESICEGETYTKNGFNESKGGIYTKTLQSSCNCDSIVTLHLNVIPLSVTTLFDVFCVNELYTGRGFENVHATKDTVLETKSIQQGCLSTVNLYLTACHPQATELNDICRRGVRYQKYGYDFTAYNDTVAVLELKTVNNCDSIVTLNLDVYHDYYFEDNKEICRGDSIFWEHKYRKEAKTYTEKYKTVMGLDSIHCLKLSYYPDYLIDEYQAVPIGETIRWHNMNIKGEGVYYDSLKTVKHQCDSVFRLRIHECTPYYFNEEKEICDGDVYDWHKQRLTQEGTYFDRNTTFDGCDSIYELKLTVFETPKFDIIVSEDYEQDSENNINQLVEIGNVHGGVSPYLCSLDAAPYGTESQYWFTNLMRGDHTFRVMDANNCVTEKIFFYKGVRVPLIIPSFFTPDDNGNNDTWVIKNLWFYPRSVVEIFDRYGKRVAMYTSEENSWDGYYNGHPLPSDDYWYVIRLADTGEKISGHFILRR